MTHSDLFSMKLKRKHEAWKVLTFYLSFHLQSIHHVYHHHYYSTSATLVYNNWVYQSTLHCFGLHCRSICRANISEKLPGTPFLSSLMFPPFLSLTLSPPHHSPPLHPLRKRALKSNQGVWGSAVSSPPGVWGRAPAKIEFGAFWP